MEINEDIPAYDTQCKIAAQTMDASAPTQLMARSLSAPEKNSFAFPAAKPYGSIQHIIHNMGDLERIIGFFREDCESAMQSGACEVVMTVYRKP